MLKVPIQGFLKKEKRKDLVRQKKDKVSALKGKAVDLLHFPLVDRFLEKIKAQSNITN